MRIGNGFCRKAAVARIAGKEREIAEIFVAGKTIRTMAAGTAKPGNADAHAEGQAFHAAANGIDTADNLMAGDDGQFGIGQIAVDDMEIGAADAAGGDGDTNFAGPW